MTPQENPALPVKEVIRPTTFVEPGRLGSRLGVRLTIASETFQHTGSFKFRAAYNLASKVEQQRIITASSGNFGQAMAYACLLLGKSCIVVMPQTSAQGKRAGGRERGGCGDLSAAPPRGRAKRGEERAQESSAAPGASPSAALR